MFPTSEMGPPAVRGALSYDEDEDDDDGAVLLLLLLLTSGVPTEVEEDDT